MGRLLTIPSRVYAPGAYNGEILTPTRANGAKLTLTRETGWPSGDILVFRLYERERNGTLNLITTATERGGTILGKDGTVNPPLIIGLKWAVDADRDMIRFEFDVLQTFTTAVTLEFV